MTTRPIANEGVLPESEVRDLLLRYRLENWNGIQPPELQEEIVRQLMHCDPDPLFSAVAAYLEITPESRILDIGSGVGSFVAACRDRGLRCFGIEPDRIGNGTELTAVQIARRRVAQPAFTVGVGESLPFADRVFDLITMNQVIEHVDNQRAVLAEATRVLADGGVLYLACPNYLCFYEPHYKIFWFPLMPKTLGKLYLRLRGRRGIMLDQITYTTNRRIRKLLIALGPEFVVVDLHREQFLRKRRENSFAGRATRVVSRLTHLPVLGVPILKLVLWFGSVREGGCEWAVIRTSIR